VVFPELGPPIVQMFLHLEAARHQENQAVVDASNKIRLGNTSVTVIEGQVTYRCTYTLVMASSARKARVPLSGMMFTPGRFRMTSRLTTMSDRPPSAVSDCL
jgi:hypothetical protein